MVLAYGCGICGVESLGDGASPLSDCATQTFDMRFTAQCRRAVEALPAHRRRTHASVWHQTRRHAAGRRRGRWPPRGARQAPWRARAGGPAPHRGLPRLPTLHGWTRPPLCGVDILCRFCSHGARREKMPTLRMSARGLCACGWPLRSHASQRLVGAGRKALRLSRSSSASVGNRFLPGPVFHSGDGATFGTGGKSETTIKFIKSSSRQNSWFTPG